MNILFVTNAPVKNIQQAPNINKNANSFSQIPLT